MTAENLEKLAQALDIIWSVQHSLHDDEKENKPEFKLLDTISGKLERYIDKFSKK